MGLVEGKWCRRHVLQVCVGSKYVFLRLPLVDALGCEVSKAGLLPLLLGVAIEGLLLCREIHLELGHGLRAILHACALVVYVGGGVGVGWVLRCRYLLGEVAVVSEALHAQALARCAI